MTKERENVKSGNGEERKDRNAQYNERRKRESGGEQKNRLKK